LANHSRNGQARKDTARQHERHGNAQVEHQAGIVLRMPLFGQRVHDAAKREGESPDGRGKGVEEIDDEHAGAREAIGAEGRARGAHGRGHYGNAAPGCVEMERVPEAEGVDRRWMKEVMQIMMRMQRSLAHWTCTSVDAKAQVVQLPTEMTACTRNKLDSCCIDNQVLLRLTE